ncbi:zf-HC2 domain-containing protein [Dehalobacterium formicoaceticum]|uniref:zf-HC2 domain-containing protein n=1 Tax=Dehalobacterium formicoaceticum TaxID=51515 RepID=UPI0031F6973F
MECQVAKLKIFSFLDQELSTQEEEALFEHLAQCPECSLEFDNLEATHHLIQQALIPVVPPPDLTERIMAQIPLSAEPGHTPSVSRETVGKSYLSWLLQKGKELWGKGQFRVAFVTVGIFALFAATGIIDTFLQQVPLKLNPEHDIAQVEPGNQGQVKPGNQEDPGSQDEPVTDPESEVKEPIPQDGPSSKEQGTPEPAPPDNEPKQRKDQDKASAKEETTTKIPQQPAKVVPDQKTNLVELPKASAVEEQQVTAIGVKPLLEGNTQRVSHPVLSKDGSSIHYLYDNAGVEEEWEISLASGAVPQKAESLLIQNGENKDQGGQIPQWINELAMVQEAKSKKVTWSPDKRQVAVNLDSPGTDYDGLWIGEADGSMMTHVTDEGGGAHLVWSPNSSKIAFTDRAKHLSVLYLKENLLIQLTGAGESWRNLNHLFWIPGGRELIFEGQRAADQAPGIFRVTLP